MSSLLFFLCVSVLLQKGYSQCVLPTQIDKNDILPDIADKTEPITTDDETYFYCGNSKTLLVNHNGVKSFTELTYYSCDPATSQWVDENTPGSSLPAGAQVICITIPSTDIPKCTINSAPGYDLAFSVVKGDQFSCVDGKGMKVKTTSQGFKEGYVLKCENKEWTLDDQYPVADEVDVECVDLPPTTTTTTTAATTTTSTSTSTSTSTTTTTPKPTTTTTTTPSTTTSTTTTTTAAPTTTTVRRDQKLLSSNMLELTVYYNVGLGLHAFCSTPSCLNSIQSNGIGYDTSNAYKYVMGKVVSTDPSIVAAAKDLCPIGWANMRLLGFTKAGQAYVHNLNGEGLIMGYVSIGVGTCGATVKIKKWKSKVNADIIYGIDLEGNSWYSGMVQDGGLPQWYMWPYDY